MPIALGGAILSGLLMGLANPPAFLWPLAFVAMIPFFWFVREARPRRGFLLALAFGFAYYGSLVYWILLFGELAWTGMTLANALYPAVFGLLAPAIWRRERPVLSASGLTALWTGFELLRGTWPLGGLTWGDVGYTQADNRFLLPLSSVTGVWGVTFVVVLVNLLLVVAIERWGRARSASLALVGVCIAVVLVPALIPIPEPNGRPVDVAAVQIEVPKGLALDPDLEDRIVAERHAKQHTALVGDPPDLVIWAENALDKDPQRDASLGSLVEGSVKSVGAPTLVGAITGPEGGRQFNQSLLYDSDASIIGRYSKVHLVPFGEYVPWRDRLGFLDLLEQVPRDLTPGKGLNTLEVNGIRFAAVICYENAFPSIDQRLVADGAGFLVVSTNNASYLRTAASSQHLIMSRFRAVENARWVVHSAISGISAFIDPEGRVYDETKLFEPTIIRRTIRTSDARTIYNRFGDWFPWSCLVFALALAVTPRGRERRGSAPGPLRQNPKTLVILPTYNERGTIQEVVTKLIGLPAAVDVLVVDDGSPDGTGGLVEEIAANDPRVRLLQRNKKAGLASAYLQGFELAANERYDLVVEMDSDLSHDPAQLPSLLAAAQDHDLVIGSRYVPGGSVTNWGVLRRLLSRAGNAYARFSLGFPLTDATSGYRAYRRPLLEALLKDGIHSEGYSFQVELALRSWLHGGFLGEVPITFKEREHGHSKFSRRIVVEALWLVGVWGLRERFRPSRLAQLKRP
ncbi:MAG: apolipoprotein N-acyltransferase [Actinomycetota bacterium]